MSLQSVWRIFPSTCSRKLSLGALLVSTALTLSADGGTVFPAGARAELRFTVQVEGQYQREDPGSGGHQRWKGERTLEVTTDMVADKPRGQSAFLSPGRAAAPDVSAMQALQKEIEACGTNDACKMAATMRLAQSAQVRAMMQASEAAAEQPLRYQAWKRDPSGSIQARARIDESFDGVFVTAEKEHTQCTYQADVENGEMLKALGAGVEVDTETGRSAFMGWPDGLWLDVTHHCVRDFGSERDKTETVKVRFMPVLDGADRGPAVSAAIGGGIAGGRVQLKGKLTERTLANVPTEVDLSLSWTLVPGR